MADKDAEIAKGTQYRTDLEKTRIALAAGLKIEYADRLRGASAGQGDPAPSELSRIQGPDRQGAQVDGRLGDNTAYALETKKKPGK